VFTSYVLSFTFNVGGILGVGIGSSSDSSSAVITLPTRNRGATNRSGSNLQGGVSLSSVSSSATAMEVDTSSSTIGVVASSGGTNSTSTAIVDLTTEDSSDDESVVSVCNYFVLSLYDIVYYVSGILFYYHLLTSQYTVSISTKGGRKGSKDCSGTLASSSTRLCPCCCRRTSSC